ncbi:DMT family transporter [Algicella marina]|uniref:EamA family transporter n=1 Tax=Algicella marina TaxID=2683284 RepID=A0A6P1T5U1_9RHOB|nr:DMT family transporter [Algicella marina]QHQ37125.1 EamA family transporter [Algicella marina]
MELWIPITIAAAFFQNIRFLMQKRLTSELSTLGVTFARFLFAAPLAVMLAGTLLAAGQPWPGMNAAFFGYALVGALAQIVATALLVALFGLRNFAVGVTFSKTETVMTAILSALVLGELMAPGGLVAILITVVGVVVMSGLPGRGALATGIFSGAAGIGILSGVIFAMASIGYRGAALALEQGDFLIRAVVTLAFVTTVQAVAMAAWMRWREPGQVRRVARAWPRAGLVGLFGMLGSLGWFAAFALQNAAYVKALGQVELVFTVLTSVLLFGERLKASECLGIALIGFGIIVLVL